MPMWYETLGQGPAADPFAQQGLRTFEDYAQQASSGVMTPDLQNQINQTGSTGSLGGDAGQGQSLGDLYTQSQQDYSKNFDPNGSVQGVPSLAADAFQWNDAYGGWTPNATNEYLNKLMNTAGYGRTLSGLSALVNTNNNNFMTDLGNSSLTDATKKSLAAKLGIDANSADWEQQLQNAAKDYVFVGGMSGNNPNDARQGDYTLYKRGEDGGWNPIQNESMNIAEKGSWLKERDYLPLLTLAPLAAAGIGAAAGAVGGAAAGGSGAATAGAAGAGGAAAGGSGGLMSSLGSLLSSGTGGLGTSALGSAANAVGLGGAWSSLPVWAQTALGGALQGAGTSALTGGDIGKGALLGGLGGGLGSGVSSGLGSMGVTGLTNQALTGAATGAATSAVGGGNALTGGLMGGLTSGVGGAVKGLTGLGSLGQLASQATGYGANMALQNAFKDEDQQQVQSQLSNLRQIAAQKGIPENVLNYVLSTPQGQQAFRAMVQEAGPGKLRSLLG